MVSDLWEKIQYIWYDVIRCNVRAFWDWFWYYRRGKVKFRVIEMDGMYNVMASTQKRTVCNCYGSTLEMAKQVAMVRLNNFDSIVGRPIESLKGYYESIELANSEPPPDEYKNKIE